MGNSRNVILVGCLMLAACGAEPTEEASCIDGKCDGTAAVPATLASRNDVIAKYLLTLAPSAKGEIKTNYATLIQGIEQLSGCDPAATRTFVVSDNLLSGKSFPRVVTSVCANDLHRGSEFFASLPNATDNQELDDKNIELFAWDADARLYRFYDIIHAGSRMQVDPSPTRCRGCHLSPTDVDATQMAMTPIMNELTKPWTHWNAAPGFPSHQFDMPNSVAQSKLYLELTQANLGQASDLEQLIRAGHSKVGLARLRQRREAANWEQTMGLLRPLFCSEQINYLSEDFAGGTLNNSIVVDDGLREALKLADPAVEAYAWMNPSNVLRLGTGEGLVQVPVRGNSDIEIEKGLLNVGALTPAQVLAVRALDWGQPVLSHARCELWQAAFTRFRKAPPELSGLRNNAEALVTLLGEVLTIEGMPLLRDDGQLVALEQAGEWSALAAALKAGSVPTVCGAGAKAACLVTPSGFAQQIDRRLPDYTQSREAIKTIRDARICKVIADVKGADERFPKGGERVGGRPSLPAVRCK